jgi:hypothetical protein
MITQVITVIMSAAPPTLPAEYSRVDARSATARHLCADAPVVRGGIAELTLLSRHQMSAVGLLAVGGSGDDLREHGSHDARGGRTAGTREVFLLAERWDPGESFV